MSPGIFIREGSPIERFAVALCWLWRLGAPQREPQRDAVGLGSLEDAEELHALVGARRLAGAAIFASRPGPDRGMVPGRQRFTGVARFARGLSTTGQFTVLHGPGPAVARSSLGAHAVRDGNLLTLGTDPQSTWGTLQDFWVLPALADFLSELLDRPLALLPPIGLIRYDDVPGTASQQLWGQDKPDARVSRRLRRVLRAYEDAGAKLNLAITANALRDGEPAPAEEIWPGSIAIIREAISRGLVEPIAHGYLHLDTEAWGRGEVQPREFAALDRAEAERRIRSALSWADRALGRAPGTFVAPNWAYSRGALEALQAVGLPTWLPCEPGSLVVGENARETLVSTLDGLNGLDYGPLGALAGAGLPPYVVIHGGLLDARLEPLRGARGIGTLVRLWARRDLVRLPGVPGVRWVGASELLAALREHDALSFDGPDLRGPEGLEVRLRDAAGARTVRL